MKIYSYNGLDPRDTTSIRLLKLQPGEQDDPLKAELVDSSLDVYPPYEALSYTWGNEPASYQLQIASERQIAIRPNLKQVLQVLRHTNEERTLWIDALCLYSYRTAMKRLENLRFIPQFSEGFHFVSERKNSCSTLSRCTLYIPRTVLHSLLFSFRKGSEAALIGHVTERRGSHGRGGGAPGEHARTLGEPYRALP